MLLNRKYIVLVVLLALIFVVPASASTVVVSPDDMMGWVSVTETGDADLATFTFGPDTPPLGAGSAHFVLNDGTDGVILALGMSDVRIADMTRLTYSTYVSHNTGVQTLALQFNVDFDLTDNNTSWQGRMVFEPYYDNAILNNQWQTWAALAGSWWFTGSPGNITCPISAPCDIATILALYPEIGIHADLGAVLFKAGSGWNGFDGNVDAFTIGINGSDTTYDFEPGTIQCRDDGWEDFGFRNQGQCISEITSNRTDE